MRGWRYEGYRHSLAARGIKTNFAVVGFTPERRQEILTHLAQNPRLKEKITRSARDIVAYTPEIAERFEKKPTLGVAGFGFMINTPEEHHLQDVRVFNIAKEAMQGSSSEMEAWMNSDLYSEYKKLPGDTLEEKELWLRYTAPRTIYLGPEDPEIFEEGSPHFERFAVQGAEPGSEEWKKHISARLMRAMEHEAEHTTDVRKLTVPGFEQYRELGEQAAKEAGWSYQGYYFSPFELKAYLQAQSGSPESMMMVREMAATPQAKELLRKYYARLQRSPRLKKKSVIWTVGPGEEEIFMPAMTQEEAASNLAYLG